MAALTLGGEVIKVPRTMTIRPAEKADAQVIAEYNVALAAETEDLKLDAGRVGAGVAALLEDSAKGVYYVAEAEGRVVGQLMVTYEWSDWRNGNIWWIQSVYVRKEFRGQGVFARLFGRVRELASERPEVCAIRLYMHSANHRARSLMSDWGCSRRIMRYSSWISRGGEGELRGES